MKTYVLIVSKTFPVTHKRNGEETGFEAKILNVVKFNSVFVSLDDSPSAKIHTIRANYDLWSKRIKDIQEGNAILSIRYWSGKPYNSKQVEICNLGKGSGIGVQKIRFQEEFFHTNWVVGQSGFSDKLLSTISKNDGLSMNDFKEWFKGYDLSKPMAIIHFTKFRY